MLRLTNKEGQELYNLLCAFHDTASKTDPDIVLDGLLTYFAYTIDRLVQEKFKDKNKSYKIIVSGDIFKAMLHNIHEMGHEHLHNLLLNKTPQGQDFKKLLKEELYKQYKVEIEECHD